MGDLQFTAIQNLPLFTSLLFVFIVGLIGSVHCGFMCSPLCSSFAKNRQDFARYHLGRLLGYELLFVSLYALKTYFGTGNPHFSGSNITGFLFFLFLLHWSLNKFLFFKKIFYKIQSRLHGVSLLKKALNLLNRANLLKPFSIGFLNAWIPCSWLWLFLLASLQASNLYIGAGWTLVFWLSSLPALYIAIFTSRKIQIPKKEKIVQLIAFAMIAFCVVNLNKYLQTMINPETAKESTLLCH